MKLVTYESGGAVRTGVLVGDNALVDVSSVGDALQILSDPAAREQARAAVADPNAPAIPLDGVRLRAPITPRNLICIGLNYMEHCRETNSPVPTKPVIFAKFSNALSHPGDTITWHADASAMVDYEAELGVIIGKPCARVSQAEALDYVGGYVCVNDVSARDIQNSDGGKQWVLGKTFDGFAPVGPVLVTADEIPDPQVLDIRCVLNGQVVQNSNTKDMIFPVARLISHISHYMTLRPGDLISTGTPFGVGVSRTPPLWMKDGDEVIVQIEKIGSLCNKTRVL
jgi:2-keto-4-pentenoate hydratase/2-oxohepta-3-ene-1,7-dioic acid hydratase in catechol pathway